MALAPSQTEQELESLTQFLYAVPIGLVQVTMDGEILLLNPESARLLMPLAGNGELTNLFDVLEGVAPDLRVRARSHAAPFGPVCENLPLQIAGGVAGRSDPQGISLTLLKLDASRLMAVVDDIATVSRRDATLRRSGSSIGTLVADEPASREDLDAGRDVDSLPEHAPDALIQFLYQAPIGLLQTTLDGEITMINPMSAQLLMPLAPDGDLLNLFDVLEPVAPELRQLAATTDTADGVVCDGLRIQMPRPPWSSEQPSMPRADAPPRTIAIRLLKLGRKTLVASVADVTLAVEREQQRLLRTKHDASRIDALSGLPNRSVAVERIAAALASADAGRFAVLFVNCDRFDRVNVTLGTAVGDQLLRLIGGRLNGTVRAEDAAEMPPARGEPAAARLGSDEFVLVLRKLRESDHGEGVAQRIVDALARPFVVGEHLIHVTASVGVVLSDHAAGTDPDEVLQCANIAMHEAKRAGGARCSVFHPSMKERAARLGSVESELRLALAERQLFVVYQPIVALAGGDCTGVEALVRWRHPLRGTVPPIEFIEVAEQSGLICELGDFVLNESCAQMQRWQRELGAAAPGVVSVNLSKAQLRDGGFPARVRQALAASGLAARRLQLEVTESLAAQDDTLRAQLSELKALGLTLALDDFGTGYSSLSSLHELPVDIVKIDRSFVSRLETSAHHRVLVEATVMVANSLGMGTVAEGIETEGQAAELTRLGCDKAQGYWFAKPLAAADASAWLVRHSERAVLVD